MEKINNLKKKFPILEDKIMEKWILEKEKNYSGKTQFNKIQYLIYIQSICNFNVMTPSELIQAPNIEDLVQEYVGFITDPKTEKKDLMKIGLTKRPSIVSINKQILGKIKSFCKSSGVNLTYKMDARKVKTELNSTILLRALQQIKSFSYKVMFYCQTQFGLTMEEIVDEMPKHEIFEHGNHWYLKNFKKNNGNIVNFIFFPKDFKLLLETEFGNMHPANIRFKEILISKENNPISIVYYRKQMNKIGKKIKKKILPNHLKQYFEAKVIETLDLQFSNHLLGNRQTFEDVMFEKKIEDIDFCYEKWLGLETKISIRYLQNGVVKELEEAIGIIKIELEKIKKKAKKR